MNIQDLKTKTNHVIQQCAVYLEMLSHKPYSENFEIERVFLLSRAYAMQMAQKLEHFSKDTNVQPILENIKTLLETFDNVKNGTPMNRILLTNFKTELFTWSKSIAFAMQVDHLVSQKQHGPTPSSTEFPNEETTNIHIETPENVASFESSSISGIPTSMASTQVPPQSVFSATTSGSNFGTSKSPNEFPSFFERSSTPFTFGSNSGTSSSSSGSNSGTSSSSSASNSGTSSSSSASNSGTSSSVTFGSSGTSGSATFGSSGTSSGTFGSSGISSETFGISGTSSATPGIFGTSSSATFGSSGTSSSATPGIFGTPSATPGSSFGSPNVFPSTSLESGSDIFNEMPALEPMEESAESKTAKKELDCFVKNQPASLITIGNFFLPFHLCFGGEFYRSKTSNSALESHPITVAIRQDYLELLASTEELQKNLNDEKDFIRKWTNLKKKFNIIGKQMVKFESLSSFIPQLKTETCDFEYDASRVSMQKFLNYVATCTLCQDDTCIQNLKAQYKKEANDYNAKTEEEVKNFFSSLGLENYRTISKEISENAKKQHETTQVKELENLQTRRTKLLENLQSESLRLQRESVSWDESLMKDALYATIFTDEQRLCTWNFWNENYQFDPNLLKTCLHSVNEECKDSTCKKTKVHELLTKYHQKVLTPKENELLQKIQSLKQKIADEQKQNKVDDLQRTFQNLTVHRARLQFNEPRYIPQKSDRCNLFSNPQGCNTATGLSADIYTALTYLYKPKDELFDDFLERQTEISKLQADDAKTVDLVQRYFELYHEIIQFRVAQTLVNFNVRGMINALDKVRVHSFASKELTEELKYYPSKENFTFTDLYEFWDQNNRDARFYEPYLESIEIWKEFQTSLSLVKKLQSDYESQYKQIVALVEAINSDASEKNPGTIPDKTKESLHEHFTTLLTLNQEFPFAENVENLTRLRQKLQKAIRLRPKDDCKVYSILGNQTMSLDLQTLCTLNVDKTKIIEYIKYLETNPSVDKDFTNYTNMYAFYQKNFEKLKQIAQDWNNPNHVSDIRETLKEFFQIPPKYETGGFYDDYMKYYNMLNYYYHLNNFQIIEEYQKNFPDTNPFDACDLKTRLPIVMSHETNDARQMMALGNCNEALDDAKFTALINGRKTDISNEIITKMNTPVQSITIYFENNATLIDKLKKEFEFCSKLLKDDDFEKINDLSKWMHSMEQAEFKGDTCIGLRKAIMPSKRSKLWAADTVDDIHKTIGIQMGEIARDCLASAPTKRSREVTTDIKKNKR